MNSIDSRILTRESGITIGITIVILGTIDRNFVILGTIDRNSRYDWFHTYDRGTIVTIVKKIAKNQRYVSDNL